MTSGVDPHSPERLFPPGKVLAEKYEVVKLIGEGGMGAVFEARHRTTLKRCALKVLSRVEFAHNAELVNRFFREAQASSVVESDHIVQVFDSGFDGLTGCPYMIMELLDGEDLEHTVKRLGRLPPVVAAKVVLQAATGLARAHEKGIVHRDIKPANMYLTRRDSGELAVKLLDFGIAKVRMENFAQDTGGAGHGLTRTGSMLGTPLYMSPEQAKGASKVDARADVWSLGVALFEFLTGRLPFDPTDSLGELLVNIITGELRMVQDVAPWVPPELAEITHRAISRDLSKRYQNAGELRDALAAILPEGSKLTPDMFVPVSDGERLRIAPRLVLSDDGMLRARTRTGLAVSAYPPARAGSSKVFAMLAAGVVLAATIGTTAFFMSRNKAQAEPSRLVQNDTVRGAPSSEPEEKTFVLPVSPPEAKVRVDGSEAQLVDGGVAITGPIGATRKVRVLQGDRSIEQIVVIAQAGLVPPSISLPEPTASSSPAASDGSKTRPDTTRTKPAEGKKPEGATTATGTKGPGPKLSDDRSEFQ